MPDVVIKPANLSMTSWVAAYMRDIDKREIYPMQTHERSEYLAYQCVHLAKRWKYNVFIDNVPVATYGILEPRQGLGELFAFGTKRIYGAMRVMTDHIRNEVAKEVFADQSIHRLECRSSVEHKQAHGWIKSIGMFESRPLDNYGKNGEDYLLFEVTRKSIGSRSWEQYLKDMEKEYVRR